MYLRPFNPGTSPCRDACSLEWAIDAAGLDVGPNPIISATFTVPAGSQLSWISYAQDGVPFGDSVSMVTVEPLEVEGFRLTENTWFVKFEACGNWAIAHIGHDNFFGIGEHQNEEFGENPVGSMFTSGGSHGSSVYLDSSSAVGLFGAGSGSSVVVNPPDVVVEIPPVPIPPSVGLMFVGLLLLVLFVRFTGKD